MRILICYASTEGQTRKIARFCADQLFALGDTVELGHQRDTDLMQLGGLGLGGHARFALELGLQRLDLAEERLNLPLLRRSDVADLLADGRLDRGIGAQNCHLSLPLSMVGCCVMLGCRLTRFTFDIEGRVGNSSDAPSKLIMLSMDF